MSEVIQVLESKHGQFGSFKNIVEEDCPECGCNRAIHSGLEVPGVHNVECAACEHVHHRG